MVTFGPPRLSFSQPQLHGASVEVDVVDMDCRAPVIRDHAYDRAPQPSPDVPRSFVRQRMPTHRHGGAALRAAAAQVAETEARIADARQGFLDVARRLAAMEAEWDSVD